MGFYPDNYRASHDPYQSSREPSSDAMCAYAAFDKIEALKLQLHQAIEMAEDLPGISDQYAVIKDETSTQLTSEQIEAVVYEAERDLIAA
ncbi:hypothetical protein ACELLULO517_07550 [Acidisoma cellulosilytica]|uniref:Uncharacterized protein n=1 Tax=Acidisoma cellulosilyticum TaxID=2802395 RepID=A0A963Z1E9_9PROT|nr:hypothetical protein [Acidisoma cellulosilyticum]MCB8880085.1 hypothetical protein [Acidisoma cellulosilyticum]